MRATALSQAPPPTAGALHPRSTVWLPIVAAGIVAAVVFWFARQGLAAYFTGDDLMNLYVAWSRPFSRILFENVFYFTPGYRPMGTLVYRLLFEIAGLNAFPYR